MIDLFQYNNLSEEEFHKEQHGGMKSFRETLAHIVDCELLWINRRLQGGISLNAFRDTPPSFLAFANVRQT